MTKKVTFSITDFETTDKLIQEHYKESDMDIDLFEGVLKDSFILYNPEPLSSTFVKEQGLPLNLIGKAFDFAIIKEEAISSHTSWQEVIYTNDWKPVDAFKNKMEKVAAITHA